MKTAGIIAEYNPFHQGHAWQYEQIKRKLGRDCAIVVAMSGSFTQRGEPAILNKWLRAETAVACGASLVIELPHVFAGASAERFARGGVEILSATGIVQSIVFGSESGKLDELSALADLFADETAEYQEALHNELASGLSFPAARQRAAAIVLGTESASLLSSPNNILAIEYLKAITKLPDSRKLSAITFKRRGQEYLGTLLDESVTIASAAAIRQSVSELAGRTRTDPVRHSPDFGGLLDKLKPHMPPVSLAVLLDAIKNNSDLLLYEDMSVQILSSLRSHTPDSIDVISGMQEGLGARLIEAAKRPQAMSDSLRLETLLKQADTRRFPRTRMQRALLAMLMQIRQNNKSVMLEPPQYLRILAFDKNGRHLLKLMRKYASLPIITKASDFLEFPKDSILRMQSDMDLLATDLRSLAAGGSCGLDFDTEVVIR
jgi:predicted nucleotidyltransferase